MPKGHVGRINCSDEECGEPSVGRGLCRKHYQRWYYKTHRQKVIDLVQRYQQRNRTKMNKYRREYYWKNHTKIREYHKKYHEENKEKKEE